MVNTFLLRLLLIVQDFFSARYHSLAIIVIFPLQDYGYYLHELFLILKSVVSM